MATHHMAVAVAVSIPNDRMMIPHGRSWTREDLPLRPVRPGFGDPRGIPPPEEEAPMLLAVVAALIIIIHAGCTEDGSNDVVAGRTRHRPGCGFDHHHSVWSSRRPLDG